MQQFAVGGIDTLRGYRDDQFKGNRMFTTTLEYRFPIVKRVQGAFFTDIGNAWDTDSSSSGTGFKAGYGFGVSVVSPFGPVRVDYAFGNQGSRIHFMFGGKF